MSYFKIGIWAFEREFDVNAQVCVDGSAGVSSVQMRAKE